MNYMSKIVSTLAVLAILAVPVTAYAWNNPPKPRKIYQFNCGSDDADRCSNEVAYFDNKGDRCYVAYDLHGSQSSISCVRSK